MDDRPRLGHGIDWCDADWAHDLDGTEPAGDPQANGPHDTADEPEPAPERARGSDPRSDDRLIARLDGSRTPPRWIVSCDGDAVSFLYWSKTRTDAQGRTLDDPYNVNRYRGARTYLLHDEHLRGIGYTSSEIAILKANALKESGGKFGAINTWDRQLVSWGMAQFAGFAGTLARVLRSTREHAPAAYQRRIARHGLDVADGPFPHLDRKTGTVRRAVGWHVVVTKPDLVLRGDEALWQIRREPALLGALMLAGNDLEIQLGQCRYWRDAFLRAAVGVEVPGTGRPISAYLNSEYGLGLVARLFNWMPAYIKQWSGDFFAELRARHPDLDVNDPAHWNDALEQEFTELLKARRRAVKSGSYDDYGPALERARGSFVHPEVARAPMKAHQARTSEAPRGRGTSDGPVAGCDVDLCAVSPVEKRKRVRAWSAITGITLHQTGIHGFGERAWKRVTAHVGVHSDGRVYLIHPLESYLWASNGFNRDTVAIEVAGNFLRDEGNPRSYWKKGGGPSTLTPVMEAGLRRAIRFIMDEVERNGGRITHIHAHRQANANKASCPGAAIWKAGGVWAQEELGQSDGGPGYTRADGLPIPAYWDPRLPVTRGPIEGEPDVDDFEPELGAEHPDDVSGMGADAAPSRSVRVQALPRGLREAMPESPALARGLVVRDELAAAGLERVDTLELEADEGEGEEKPRARGTASAVEQGEADDVLELEVALPVDETAVVLVEHDGVLSWVMPPREELVAEPRARGRGRRVRLLRLLLRAAELLPASDGQARTGKQRIAKRLRAHVYAVAAVAVERLADAIDGRVATGLVHVAGPSLGEWRTLASSAVPKPEARRPKVLLLVHGAFSSTRGAFGALTAEAGRAVLERMLSSYDLVLGYDHRTLTVSPEDNARDLLQRLQALPWRERPSIDVIAHSRGGLVARTLVERVLPAAGAPGLVDRMVLVAATNAGTKLARPEKWRLLIDVMTTLATTTLRGLSLLPGVGASASLIGGPVLRGLGALVAAMATHALDEDHLPGLAAMVPGSPFLAALNEITTAPWTVAPRYCLLLSDFDAQGAAESNGAVPTSLPRRAAAWAASRVVRPIFDGADNDLVVDNASSRTLPAVLGPAQEQRLGDNLVVHHLNVFEQTQVHELLGHWLGLGDAVARPPGWRRRLPAVAPRGARGPRGKAFRGPVSLSPVQTTRDLSGRSADEGDAQALFVRGQAPRTVRPAAAFDVKVELSADPLDLPTSADVVSEAASATIAREEALEVELVGTSNVQVEGWGPVRVRPPAAGQRVGVYFTAHAGVEGPAEVAVRVRQRGHGVLQLRLALTVASGLAEDHDLAQVTAARPHIELAEVAPDVQLEVTELREPSGIRYRYVLTSERDGRRICEDSRLIGTSVADFMTARYNAIEEAWQRSGGDPKAFERGLEGVGNLLAEQLVPKPIREALWGVRERVESVSLVSDSMVPWELLLLTPPDDDDASPVFLGELGVVRSAWDSMPAPRIEIASDRAFVVAPRYTAPRWRLPSAEEERDFVIERLAAKPLPATSHELAALLQGPGKLDLLHYAGHGELFEGGAALVLDVKHDAGPPSDVLTDVEIGPRTRLRRKGARGGPLVFLNACKIGRSRTLLSSMGGWAHVLLAHGAGAVVAPLWSVGDGAALRFAEGFYAELLAGGTFAEASRKARQHARQWGDPTWLAYVVYAQAGAVLEVK